MKNLLRILFALTLLPCSLSFGQGVIVAPQTAFKVVNGLTSPIANATITVCAANASGIPCSPALANSIFKDAALTLPLSNPFFSDSTGNYQFAIAPGNYTITVTNTGFNGQSYQMTVATPISLASGLADPGANGVVFRNGFGTTRPAVSADVIALFSGSCSVSTFIRGDGSCASVSSAFSAIASGSNTTAAMVVDTGASLATTGSGTIAATSVPFSGVAAGSNLNALTFGNAGSLKPVNLGQIAGDQAWLQPGIPATAVVFSSNTGGLLSTNPVLIEYTFVSPLGESLPSAAFQSTNPGGICASGSCQATVTAPTIPSGYTGYTVYSCQAASAACTPVRQAASAACVNITGNCVISTIGAGAAVPTINTAIIQPSNIQAASLVPPGSAPSIYFPKTDGNYYPLAGMDFSSGVSLPSPDGTFEFWHRLFVNDTGLSIGASTGTNGPIKNAMVSFSHVSGATTSTGSTTDDRVIAFRGVDSPTSPLYEQWLGIYGEQFVQNANFGCSPIGGGVGAGEDCIAAIRARSNMSVHTTSAATGLVGIHGVASTAVSNPSFGSCSPCIVGVVGSADQEVIPNQNAPIFYAGVMGVVSAFGTPTGGSGWGLLSALGTRFATQNGGLLIKNSFSGANAADYAILSEASARSVWLGPQYFTKWGTNLGTLSVVGSIAQTGSFGTSQLVTPIFSNGNITPIGTTGATTYTYKVVAIDGNGAAVAASATGTTSIGNATLDGTNKNRITVSVCNGLTGTSADMLGYSGINVYRTVGGATQGKIGSMTLTVQGDQTTFTLCNITFDDTGLAGDASTAPTVNTTGGVNVAGDITLTSGKGQHVNTQASNNDFAGTCTASAATTCTVTFTRAYTAAPICTAADATNITTLKVTPSTTSLIITTTGASSDVFDYICAGNPN